MEIVNQYITTFFSSYKLYKMIDEESFLSLMRPYLFLETKNSSLQKVVPDYIYKEVESELFNHNNLRFLLIDFFDKLSDFLIYKNNNIYVKEELFQEWQSIITRVSPLMIISYFMYKNNLNLDKFNFSLLPSIYNKRLEYLFEKYEVYDLHIHLNGTTEADIVWQDILKLKKDIFADFQKGFKEAKEVYLEFGIENISDFIEILKKNSSFRKKYQENYGIKCEIEFFKKFFEKLLNNNLSLRGLNDFYKYILVYNVTYKLIVQQISHIGFDNFQKITKIEIREQTEKDYKNRFKQIKTIYNHNSIKIEGRFAPKKEIRKFINLLDKIFEANNTASLVGHFIKQKDRLNKHEIICRDFLLRKDLFKLFDNYKVILSQSKYKHLINGFDAAANELHARPEVFAPIFKRLRELGHYNFTFHAGEDFIDLVSGIRYIFETIEFLEFQSGNRIGHATAIGINPKLWKKRIGEFITISQGEYLDNLLFFYYFIKSELKPKKIFKIEEEILKLSRKIYGKNYSINELISAWLYRKNDPLDKNCLNNNELFKLYHTDDEVIKNYNKKIKISTDFFSNKEIIKLQNNLLKLLNKKNIIIESMITSNKIISFYNSYYEHHISRWLLKSPIPVVVIASDDPGIFATNLKNEFAHLYLILKKQLDNEEKIFNILERLAKNSEIYRFV